MEFLNLIKDCQNGNSEAFHQLYKLHSARAMRTAYFISGQRGIAEDIVQEAFIQAFKDIGKLRNPENFSSWFYSILVRNGWKMAAKCNNPFSLESINENVNYSSFEQTVEELIEAREIHGKVQEVLKKLSIQMRTVIVLYYYNGMTIKEISRTTGCFQGTVKSRLHNAKKLIKKELTEYFGEETIRIMFRGKECVNNGL